MKPQKKRKSIQDILKARQKSSFVGREEQIKIFSRNLNLPLEVERDRFIFNVWGQGGVGKTTLLKQFRKIAEENQQYLKTVTAFTDDDQKSVPEAMGRLAAQFEEKGHKLGKFTERYQVYRQKQQELESDPEAPQGFSAFLGKTVAKGGLNLAKQIPGMGIAAGMIDEDAFASQTGEWAAYVAKKLTNKDEVKLVREPIEVLTPIFLEEISQVLDEFNIVLFFDTYERTDDFLDSWLLDVFEGRYGDVPSNILFVIAGRQELDKNRWADYEGLIARLPLEVFTEEEAQQYLARKGITDEKVIKVILELSGRFPLLVATLAAEIPNDPSKIGDSSGTAVERFLKWVDDPKRREVALDAAIPRYINEDILIQLQGEQGKVLFNWLKEMPFINERHEGWVYHDVVRTQMLRYKRRLSSQSCSELHGKLGEYYDNLRNDLQLDEDKAWLDKTWFSYTLDVIYHRLCESSHKYLSIALNEFLIALKNKRELAQSFAERILQAGNNAESTSVKDWGEKLVEGLKSFEDKRYEEAVKMFNALVESSEIEVKYLPVALDWRGYVYLLIERYEDAIKDFESAIEIDPNHKLAIVGRGNIYGFMERYEDAIKDFESAIEIDPNYKWAIAPRGYTYSLMKRYEDAIKDFESAIEIDPNYKWAIALRGKTYRLMECYEDAIKDFNRAIEINPNYDWAIAQRGKTYRSMKRYEDALKDFNRAIEIDPDYKWALEQKIHTYLEINCHEDALQDLNCAIEIDPDYKWAIAQRGNTYRLMECYEDAIKDFDRAIEIDPSYKWAIALRGNTYRLMESYEDAIKDFDRAIEIDPNYKWAIAQRGDTYLSMECYEDALKDFDRAIEIDPDYKWAIAQRGKTYRLMESYEDALKDFDRAIEIDPDHKWAIAQRGHCYLMIKQYEKALTNLNRAVELDKDSDWKLYLRALAYKALNQSHQAQIDLAKAVELAKPKHQENPQDWRNTFNLALYYLAVDYTPTAKYLYELALSQDASQKSIRDAIRDLDDFLKLFPNHVEAEKMRKLLNSVLK